MGRRRRLDPIEVIDDVVEIRTVLVIRVPAVLDQPFYGLGAVVPR